MSKSLRHVQASERLLDRALGCPFCSRAGSGVRQLTSHRRRTASTLSSNTAVNASRSVPAKYKPLYTALSEVRRDAPGHMSFSRLQLALQGLESIAPKIRIAILGLNVQDTARRLVRLLLADPLEPPARWETELADNGNRYDNGVVIRFGQPANPNLTPPRSAIPTLDIPAPLLERNNLEILVSAISGPSAGRTPRTPIETFLAPAVGTPTAYSGRQTMITQPVHKALVVARGLEELFQVAELLASTDFISEDDKRSITVAMQHTGVATDGQVRTVDIIKAESGLRAIRTSLSEATTYEHQWVDSGMPNIAEWLAMSSNTEGTIPPQISALLSSILQSASASLEAQAERDANAQGIDLSVVTNLGTTVDEFSRNAHQELQSGLASAWSSRNWQKLAWYKLFWRVDDVGLIVTDLVTNAWLPRTERAVYELSGRLAQAGISPMDMINPPPETAKASIQTSPAALPLPILQAQTVSSETPVEPVIANEGGTAAVIMQLAPQLTPLSSSMSATRAAYISRAVDSLSSQAQQLVLRTLSITGLSAGLSGLTYLSLTPGNFYEAGTIVAAGTAFALWRMQGGWQRATKDVEDELFDEGRSTIKRIVGRMRQLVEEKSQPRVDRAEEQRWRAAWGSVERAKAELDKLKNQDQQGSTR